jgi:hypothetical protein
MSCILQRKVKFGTFSRKNAAIGRYNGKKGPPQRIPQATRQMLQPLKQFSAYRPTVTEKMPH